MNIECGGIYVLSKEWNPYEQPIMNHRPVIVLRNCQDYVEAVSMGMLFSNSKKRNQLMIEYFVEGKKYIAAISCDIIQKIPHKYIQNYIGYVDEAIVKSIEKCSGYFDNSSNEDQTEKTITSNNFSEGVTITNSKEHDKMVEELYSDMKIVTEFVKDSKKLKNIWKERIVGFIFGIIASIIASAIWENEDVFSDIIRNIISCLENFINVQ